MTDLSSKQKNKVQPQYSQVLATCRDQVMNQAHGLLTDMFMGADDALLEAANKAESNAAQSRYFEAMREIRQKRIPVEHAFREEVLKGFEAFLEGRQISSGIRSKDSKSELSLVEKAEVDEAVAVQNIISKANNNFFHLLYELRQRLAVINRGKKVDSTNTPSGPSHLCKAFRIATQSFEADTEVNLIIFSLFDQLVMRKAATIYTVFNKILLEAGILPNISSAVRKGPDGQQAAQPTPPEQNIAETQENPIEDAILPEMDEPASRELYQSLFQLLARRREETPGSGLSGTRTRSSDTQNWAPIARANLASVIGSLQPANSTSYGLPNDGYRSATIDPVVDEQLLETIKNTLIREREKLFTSVSENNQSVNTIDADIIELVGMLFEFMLNYEALPNAVKALISHLHTPFLKVAVLDKEFLIRASHPARRLLNLMVDAGCRWVNEAKLDTGIFPNIQEMVERVLDEFSDNVTLFDELLESFSATVEEFKTKSQFIETRAREAAKGRDKLQKAKQKAVEHIKARIGSRRLPEELQHFLLKPWTDRLTFILLRNQNAEESEDWNAATKIVDALVWAVGPKNTDEERHRLKSILPKLRQSVEQGLTSMGGYSQVHTEILFDTIEEGNQSPETRLRSRKKVAGDADSEKKDIAAKEASPKHATAVDKASKKKTAAADEKPETQKTEALAAAQKSPAQKQHTQSSDTAATPVEQSPEVLAKVQELKNVEFGTWFELHAGDQKPRRRAKLSWFSPVTKNYMFVDSAGVQCAVISIEELARDITDGKSILVKVSRVPFVDRALKSMRNMLGRPSKQPA